MRRFLRVSLLLLLVEIDATPAEDLQKNLQRAADALKPSFTVASGDYNFTTSLFLREADGLIVTFATNVNLWFPFGSGVQLVNCQRVRWLGSAVIDYDPPTYAQGIVTKLSIDKTSHPPTASVEADFDANFPMPHCTTTESASRPCPFCKPYNSSTKIAFWDKSARTMLRDSNLPGAINIFMTAASAIASQNNYKLTMHGNLAPLFSGGMRVPVPGESKEVGDTHTRFPCACG